MSSYLPEFLSHCALKLISSFAKISQFSLEKQASGALVKGTEAAQRVGFWPVLCSWWGSCLQRIALGPGSLHGDGKGSCQFPVTKISNCMCIWVPSLLIGSLDFMAQSAFPPSSQLASANALVLLGLCNYHLASNTEEGKEAICLGGKCQPLRKIPEPNSSHIFASAWI